VPASSRLHATWYGVSRADVGASDVTLVVDDTADHVINASEATVVSFTVGGLDDETGTATFTDGTHSVQVAVNGNGVYQVDLSSQIGRASCRERANSAAGGN